MKFKNVLIIVEDLKKSVSFYQELFDLKIIAESNGNVIMTGELCFQERKIWEATIGDSVVFKGCDMALHFEENDIAEFQSKLEKSSFDIEYVNDLMTNIYGQQIIRIYDPDQHVIEIIESMDSVKKREKHSKKKKPFINEKRAKEELEKRYDEAEKILNDDDQLEKLLKRLENKLKVVPVAGEQLSNIPIMVSFFKSYVKKEYTNIPIGTIIAIVSALIYFVSPIDVIPDNIPGLGHVDDAAVVAVCWKFVSTDIEEYVRWREENKTNESNEI